MDPHEKVMKMFDPLLDKVAAFYTDAINKHGPVAQGVNWKSARDQDVRFAYLTELIPVGAEPVQVADLGCGYAALYSFLKNRGIPLARYVGYDVSEAMIESARDRIGRDDGVELRLGDRIDHEVDYAFASGIFNVSLGQQEEAWKSLAKATLDNMNAMSRRGFAFNMMTDKVDWKVDELFYANPGEFFEHCAQHYSRRSRLYHDMPLFEWTMVVFKDR